MEYLAPEHQDLAKQGLDELRGKLPSPQEIVLENLKAEELPFPRVFRKAQEYTSRNLPTASIIWEYMLSKATNKQQKFAIMNKLFQVQIATGPWEVALETAQKLFNEIITECAAESTGQQLAKEGGLDPFTTALLLFDACMNLGSIHRLLKELDKAEQLYHKACEIAASVKDFDKETFAKIHLAICLLDRGELKEAIETYFEPLMVFKSTMKTHTKALYLQYYGNACRSAADWGRAKEYLREALDLTKEVRDIGLVSSCCGDLGNVYRSEGRYKDAERLHTAHHDFALNRGDIHGLAISCGNIGFLKFYNPDEFDDSVVYQFIEYSLAEEVGDFARMGIAFNKIGKLYTTLGYNEEALEMFQIALDGAQRADNVAGEGMAWGNLGTVYRAIERFDDAISCHVKYKDNAERRMDIGGLAIMQHQLAMDYFLDGKLLEAEMSILGAFQTLEKIRSQIGEEDKSKLSNFEKNQAEAYNLLQVVLVAEMKYKEALVLADASRGRALAEIVRKRLCGCISTGSETTILNEEFIEESFNNLLKVSRKLSTTLVFYSVVKEFDKSGALFTWVYAWVLHPCGRLHFSKARLQHGITTKVELNDDFVVSLRRSMSQPSQIEDLSKILRCEKHLSVSREGKAPVAMLQSEDVLNSLKGLEHMFASGCPTNTDDENNLSWDFPYKTKEKVTQDRITLQCDEVAPERESHGDVESGKSLIREPEEALIHEASSTALQSQIHTEVDKDLHILQIAHSEADITPLQCVNHTEVQKDESPVTTTDETTLPGPLNDAMAEPSSTHSKPETANSVASSTSLQSAKHSEVEKDFVTVGCDVYESNSPDSLNDATTEPSGAHSKHEPENSVASSTPLQSAKDSETEKNPVTTGWDVSDNISPGSLNDAMTDPLDTHSKIETANSVASNTPLQSAKHSEVEKNLVIASSSDVSEGTPPGRITDAMAEPPSGTHSKLEIADSAASSTPLQSAKHSEVDEDPLTTSCDVSQSTPPGPITDVMAEPPSSTHSKLEIADSAASSTPLQSAKHSEVEKNLVTTSSSDVSEGTPSGTLNDAMADPSATNSKLETAKNAASSTPLHNAKYSEVDTDPMTASGDVSESIFPGSTNDAMTESSSTHSKLETENSAASSTPLLSAKHSEVDEDPLTASCDVSEGTPPGPITHVVTELFGTHLKEQNDERQSDPELDPWRPMLSQLHEVLIKPIVKFLPTKDENPRVTFIPQGFLLKVPFAALQGDARDHYIMQDFVISTSPAIHFLELACASRESAEHTTPTLELSLLAVGNPIMPYEELPQLPSAEHEVRMINEIINSPDSEVLIGERAKKSDVIRAMPKHNILHFATHAIIDDTDSHGDFSMKGLIFLAKSGLECNGTLTAEEVRGMELNAELVVLSCCDTGLGKVTGDGVLGLSRAFLAAGAACAIVTLWKIDDKSASELMTSFYREYKASRDAAVALQKAMKILQSNEDTRSPRHWAAFSIVGRAIGL